MHIQWGASFHDNRRIFYHVIVRGHVTNWICCNSTGTMTMATKLGRVVTCNKELFSIKSQDPLIKCLGKLTWKIKINSTRPMTNEELRVIKSQEPVIRCCCKVLWQIKYVISPLPQKNMITKLDREVTYNEELHYITSWNGLVTWSC